MLSIGFTVVAHPHSVEFLPYAQPRTRAPWLLSAAQDDLQTVIVMGRLHYREDLLPRIRHRVDERTLDQCLENDAALARAIYRVKASTVCAA